MRGAERAREGAGRGGASVGISARGAGPGGSNCDMSVVARFVRTLWLRLFGPGQEHVGADSLGNKYYRVPEHRTWAGRSPHPSAAAGALAGSGGRVGARGRRTSLLWGGCCCSCCAGWLRRGRASTMHAPTLPLQAPTASCRGGDAEAWWAEVKQKAGKTCGLETRDRGYMCAGTCGCLCI